MTDSNSKYRISIEMDKQSASQAQESVKKLTESFEKLTKNPKALSDAMEKAFSPKTIESITKMTKSLEGLEKALGSLTNKMGGFGQAMGGSSGGGGPILDQFGRPMTQSAPTSAPAGAGGSGGRGGGTGINIANGLLRMAGLPPIASLINPATASGATAYAALDMNKRLSEAQRFSDLSRLSYMRQGRDQALQGDFSEYYAKRQMQNRGLTDQELTRGGIGQLIEASKGQILDIFTPFSDTDYSDVYAKKNRAEMLKKFASERASLSKERIDMLNRVSGLMSQSSESERFYGSSGAYLSSLRGATSEFGLDFSTKMSDQLMASGAMMGGDTRALSKMFRQSGIAPALLSGARFRNTFTDRDANSIAAQMAMGGVNNFRLQSIAAPQIAQMASSMGSAPDQTHDMSIGRISGFIGQAGDLNSSLSSQVQTKVGLGAAQGELQVNSKALVQSMAMNKMRGMGISELDAGAVASLMANNPSAAQRKLQQLGIDPSEISNILGTGTQFQRGLLSQAGVRTDDQVRSFGQMITGTEIGGESTLTRLTGPKFDPTGKISSVETDEDRKLKAGAPKDLAVLDRSLKGDREEVISMMKDAASEFVKDMFTIIDQELAARGARAPSALKSEAPRSNDPNKFKQGQGYR